MRIPEGRKYRISTPELSPESSEKLAAYETTLNELATPSEETDSGTSEVPNGPSSLRERLQQRLIRGNELDFKRRDPNLDKARARGLGEQRKELVWGIAKLRRRIEALEAEEE